MNTVAFFNFSIRASDYYIFHMLKWRVLHRQQNLKLTVRSLSSIKGNNVDLGTTSKMVFVENQHYNLELGTTSRMEFVENQHDVFVSVRLGHVFK